MNRFEIKYGIRLGSQNIGIPQIISIRFLLAPKTVKRKNIFYLANRNITGPKSISILRSDVQKNGSYLHTGSALESYEI